MGEEMDFYLNRSLKNWAARHQPPANGRQRLLLAAARLATAKKEKDSHQMTFFQWHAKMHSFSTPYSRPFSDQGSFHPQSEWFIGPVTQSHIWFYHVIQYRLAF